MIFFNRRYFSRRRLIYYSVILSILVFIYFHRHRRQVSELQPAGIFAIHKAGKTRLSGQVFNARTKEPLPARILITRDGEPIQSYYTQCPGLFTDAHGRFEVQAAPGKYEVKAYHGIDFTSRSDSITVFPDSSTTLSVYLSPWVHLRDIGWVNGEGHAHLYTDLKPNPEMAQQVRKICLAQGVDFISTNQGWAGYDESNWREGYGPLSDKHFLLHYGAEMPKYRTGHTWWLGIKNCRGLFESAMDTLYENQYYQSPTSTYWTFDTLPMNAIFDTELVSRLKASANAVALIPHPTSWWMQPRGKIRKYTTNVCSYLSYSLLAGKIWDGLVVMGYDRDHYFYQNLWFHVLNEGYIMPPVAELDGGYNPHDRFYYGAMRTYYDTGGKLEMDEIVKAVKAGHTFVSSGPIALTNVDGDYKPGDIIPADGKERVLHLQAFASGDEKDLLSFVILFRNGRIFQLWDLRSESVRQFNDAVLLHEDENAWYVLKVYGKESWNNFRNFDVMQVCENIEEGTFEEEMKNENSVCMTSPFYFRKNDWKEPAPLVSKMRVQVVDPATKLPVRNVTLHLLDKGVEVKTIHCPDGRAEFDMPIHLMLRIGAEGYPEIRRGLYLDYPPHRKLIERLANGSWRKEHDSWKHLSPGQVPWEAFNFDETRHVLSNVDWIIPLIQNERDAYWEQFDRKMR